MTMFIMPVIYGAPLFSSGSVTVGHKFHCTIISLSLFVNNTLGASFLRIRTLSSPFFHFHDNFDNALLHFSWA